MKAELVPADGAGESLRKDAARKAEDPSGAAGAANPAGPSSPQNRLRLFQEDTFERAARRPLVALG